MKSKTALLEVLFLLFCGVRPVTAKCIARLQEKDTHCYMEGQPVKFTCVYGAKYTDPSKASITITPRIGGALIILDKTILGTDPVTVQGSVESFGKGIEGEVQCRYGDELCDCAEGEFWAEFESCTTTIYSERPPSFLHDFQFNCEISFGDSIVTCSWLSQASPCWSVQYKGPGGSMIQCNVNDDCPSEGLSGYFLSLQRFCVLDNSTIVRRTAFCPWNGSYEGDSHETFTVKSRKYASEISQMYRVTMNHRLAKLDPPSNVTIRNITSTSLLISWKVRQCIDGFRVRCRFLLNTTVDQMSETITSKNACKNSSIAMEAEMQDLSPFTYYRVSLSCSVDGGEVQSDVSSIIIRTNESEPLEGPILKQDLYQTFTCNTTKKCLSLYWKDQDVEINNGYITGYKVRISDSQSEMYHEVEGDVQTVEVELSDVLVNALNVSVWSVNEAGVSLNASHATLSYDDGAPEITCVNVNRYPWYDSSSSSYNVSWRSSSVMSPDAHVTYYRCLGYVDHMTTISCVRKMDWIDDRSHGELSYQIINVTDTVRHADLEWHFGVAVEYSGRSRGVTWDIYVCPAVSQVETNNKSIPIYIYIIAIAVPGLFVGIVCLLRCIYKRYKRESKELKEFSEIPLRRIGLGHGSSDSRQDGENASEAEYRAEHVDISEYATNQQEAYPACFRSSDHIEGSMSSVNTYVMVTLSPSQISYDENLRETEMKMTNKTDSEETTPKYPPSDELTSSGMGNLCMSSDENSCPPYITPVPNHIVFENSAEADGENRSKGLNDRRSSGFHEDSVTKENESDIDQCSLTLQKQQHQEIVKDQASHVYEEDTLPKTFQEPEGTFANRSVTNTSDDKITNPNGYVSVEDIQKKHFSDFRVEECEDVLSQIIQQQNPKNSFNSGYVPYDCALNSDHTNTTTDLVQSTDISVTEKLKNELKDAKPFSKSEESDLTTDQEYGSALCNYCERNQGSSESWNVSSEDVTPYVQAYMSSTSGESPTCGQMQDRTCDGRDNMSTTDIEQQNNVGKKQKTTAEQITLQTQISNSKCNTN